MVGFSLNNRFSSKDNFFRKRLQQFVANALFPAGNGDWFRLKGYGKEKKDPFNDFVEKQKNDVDAQYYHSFMGINLSHVMINSKLATGTSCQLEVCIAANTHSSNPPKPGTGKHIVYFPGANTYYQACFRDISAATKETGATLYGFNYPGIGSSTGKVTEVNDLINSGIAVVNSLLKQGIHPDDIIIQGDCYGASIALEVKRQFEDQAGIKIRLIMNNAFKSFKAIVCDMIRKSFPFDLKIIVKKLLQFTGWHITPGKNYVQAGPYQCHIQHLGDQTLESSTLSEKVSRYKAEIITGTTNSVKRLPKTDPCPQDFKKDRDKLEAKHYVRVKQEEKNRLANKFGKDKFGRINAHFADICELEMMDGSSVYENFINDYLRRSEKYIKAHPQGSTNKDKVKFLTGASQFQITKDEAIMFDDIVGAFETQESLSHDVSDSQDLHRRGAPGG